METLLRDDMTSPKNSDKASFFALMIKACFISAIDSAAWLLTFLQTFFLADGAQPLYPDEGGVARDWPNFGLEFLMDGPDLNNCLDETVGAESSP